MFAENALPAGWSRPPDGLLLGMNDVLYDTTAWRRWLLPLLGRLGVEMDYRTLCRVWQRRFAEEVCCGRRPMGEAFRAMLEGFGLSAAQVNEMELACRTRWRETAAQARPLPGVRTTLFRLRQAGVVLGVLTDSGHSSAEIHERVDQLGLAGMFTSIVSSLDLGQTKPHPMGYLRSARAMGLPPEGIAFVGHRAVELLGATAVGMRTIAFNVDADVQADVHLARFDELQSLTGAPVCRAAG